MFIAALFLVSLSAIALDSPSVALSISYSMIVILLASLWVKERRIDAIEQELAVHQFNGVSPLSSAVENELRTYQSEPTEPVQERRNLKSAPGPYHKHETHGFTDDDAYIKLYLINTSEKMRAAIAHIERMMTTGRDCWLSFPGETGKFLITRTNTKDMTITFIKDGGTPTVFAFKLDTVLISSPRQEATG